MKPQKTQGRQDTDAKDVSIFLNGRRVRVLRGQNLVASLYGKGIRVMGRSIKYHRPRGPVCGIGQCTGCLVRLNGTPMAKACQLEPAEGDVVEMEAGWPSTRHDLLGVFDLLYRDHMDTLHGFTKPAGLRTTYQRIIRRFSGLGKIPDAPAKTLGRMKTLDTDILIIGGGISGKSAGEAIDAAHARAKVTLLDRGSGQGWSVVHLPPPVGGRFTALATSPGNPARLVRARSVVLATGSYDGAVVFPGHDLPGVMTASGALAVLPRKGPLPFRKIVIFGSGDRAQEVLERLGRAVTILVSPSSVTGGLAREAKRQGVRIMDGQVIVSARGQPSLRKVNLRGRGVGSAEAEVPADALILAERSIPNSGLFFHAGAKMSWRNGGSSFYPEMSPHCATTVPGLYAAGAVAGFNLDPDARESGKRAALGALEYLGLSPKDHELGAPVDLLDRRVAPGGDDAVLSYYKDFMGARRPGKTILCPCEDVTLGEVIKTLQSGWEPTLEVVKRITGLGMGPCQGRYCLHDALEIISAVTGRTQEEIGLITQRPPVWPVMIHELAGGFDP